MNTGVMFAALALPEMILGPISGWLVDRTGSKLVTLIGFTLLCLALFSFVIPVGPATPKQIAILVSVLIFNGYYLPRGINQDAQRRLLGHLL
jgi:MFS family permease